MGHIDSDAHPIAGREVSRRTAISGFGSGAALTALSLLVSSKTVLAQAASATPDSGMHGSYLVVRQYQLAAGVSAEELIQQIQDGFVPIIREVPGFVAYYYLHEPDTGVTASISVFADQAGADESTRRAAGWIEEHAGGFYEGPPAVVAGQVGIEETAC